MSRVQFHHFLPFNFSYSEKEKRIIVIFCWLKRVTIPAKY